MDRIRNNWYPGSSPRLLQPAEAIVIGDGIIEAKDFVRRAQLTKVASRTRVVP